MSNTERESAMSVFVTTVLFSVVTSPPQKEGPKVLPDYELQVLLVQPAGSPGKAWQLPGEEFFSGYPLWSAAKEAVSAVLGDKKCSNPYLVGVFDAHEVFVSENALFVVYAALVPEADFLQVQEERAKAFPFAQAQMLCPYKDKLILSQAHDCIQKEVLQTTAVKHLLPDTFTISELAKTLQAVVPTFQVSPPNFIRKLTYTKLNVIEETGEYSAKYSQRPAKLYRFTGVEPEVSLYE